MGGTGLGLAIVKHVVNIHKGNIEISSIPGKGSCFTLKIPKNL
jgi:two-component system phosphate regulon sensor histidine kinase PhoR